MSRRLIDEKTFRKGLDKNWQISTTPDQIAALVRNVLAMGKKFRHSDETPIAQSLKMRALVERWIRHQRMWMPMPRSR